jgi:PAT family beta-lactamase induction signal transducer AmpG
LTAPAQAAERRGAREVIAALGQPNVAVMFALGFSSGLPFMLIGNTLGLWLTDEGFKPSTVGFLSAAGLAYILKFLWGPLVDRIALPLVGRLGRRRSWMLTTQLLLAAGLICMGLADPKAHFVLLAAATLATAIAAATQDCAIDAWRIEISDDAQQLGLLTSTASLGFRTALLASESLILFLATAVGWRTAYMAYGGVMIIGLAATLFAREPERADAALRALTASEQGSLWQGLYDAIIGPFVAFFEKHGWAMGAMILGLITLYHLSDYLRGPMVNPYYAALGIPKTTIGAVRAVVSWPAAMIGIAIGGAVVIRWGVVRSLLLGAVLQPIDVAAYAVLGWHGGDFSLLRAGPINLTAFETVMAMDSIVMGFAGVVLVAYMSSLTNLGYTATQFALLTSASVWVGKMLKLTSGVVVEWLEPGRTVVQAFALFQLVAAAIGLPALMLCVVLALRPRPAPTGRAT